MFGLAARSFICKITQSSDHRGTGTIFPAKRTSTGLSDFAGLYFVAGKLSQSPGQSYVLQSSGFRDLWAGLARLSKVALLRSLQRSSALRHSRSFPRCHINSPVFIEWRLTISLRGLEGVPSPRSTGARGQDLPAAFGCEIRFG